MKAAMRGGPADGLTVEVPEGQYQIRYLAPESTPFASLARVHRDLMQHEIDYQLEMTLMSRRVALYELHTDGSWRHTGWC